MTTTDEEIRVPTYPRGAGRYWLTPEGEAALEAAERELARKARELQRERADMARLRNQARAFLEGRAAQDHQIDGTPPDLL